MRKIKLQNGKYYHIYNRGADKREVFLDEKDFVRFITSMREFNIIEPIGSLYEKYLQEKRATCGNMWKSDFQRGNRISTCCCSPTISGFYLLLS